MKKIICFILAFTILFTFTACSNRKRENDNENPSVQENYLIKLKNNGEDLSTYKVVISENATDTVKLASKELVSYFEKSTGITLQTVLDGTPSTDNEIIIGNTTRQDFKDVSLENLNEEGFVLKSNGKKLYIGANGDRGILYGVYSFLEKLGYRFLSESVEFIPDDYRVFIPDKFEMTENPKFGYRDVMYLCARDGSWSAKQKINGYFLRDLSSYGGSVRFAGGEAYLVHTLKKFVPLSLYSEHPEYFAYRENLGERIHDSNYENNQLCLTNGDLVDIVVNAVKAIILNSSPEYVNVSQNDNDNYCQCENCKVSDNKYGRSGTLLNFINKVAEKLKVDYPNLKVITLAYGYTKEPPKGGVVPAENVLIECCTSSCRSHTIEEDCDKRNYNWKGEYSFTNGYYDFINGWSKVTDRFFIWDYVQNYLRINSPFPNFKTLRQNMNLFAKIGAKGIYSEGVGLETGEFAELRSYLLAKLSWNPEMSEGEYDYHLNEFLKYYYGEGYKYIRKYIDETCDYAKNVKINALSVNGSPYENLPIERDEYGDYKLDFIEKLNGYFDEAEEYATDEELYRIQKSRLQLTYWELYNTMDRRYYYGSRAERAELVSKCEKLYNDYIRYGITYAVANEKFVTNITDFTKSPRYWQKVAYKINDITD